MAYLIRYYTTFFWTYVFLCCLAKSYGSSWTNTVNIDIHKEIVSTTIELLPKSSIPIQARLLSSETRFVIFQAFSQKYNITLSNSREAHLNDSVTGFNIGLYAKRNYGTSQIQMYLSNENTENIIALIALSPHEAKDPIPGGCNIEFPIEVAPFFHVTSNKISVRLEYANANIGYVERYHSPQSCDTAMQLMSYDVFVYYISENSYSQDSLFDGLKSMVNVSKIRAMAKQVYPFVEGPKTRTLFMAYPGQAVIYNIIAKYKFKHDDKSYFEAAYVPFASYGCSFTSEVDGCGSLDNTFAKVFAVIFSICGLIICYTGHHFFKFEMMFFGFLSFSFIFFIILTNFTELQSADRNLLVMVIGGAGGLFWLAIWWLFGIPVLSVILVGLDLGLLISSCILFSPVGDFEFLRNNSNYWMTLACGTLLVCAILIPFTKQLSIISCGIVGSYAAVILPDRYLHTSLSYIILNVVKRGVKENLNVAVNYVPFQKNDIILATVWGIMAVVGIIVQFCCQRKRPPFSPRPYSVWQRSQRRRQERREMHRSRRSLIVSAPPYEDDIDERQPLFHENTRPPRYESLNNLPYS